jgi:hypothetical protein
MLRDGRKEKELHGKRCGSMLLERIFSLDAPFRLSSCTFAVSQILGNYRYPSLYKMLYLILYSMLFLVW